MTSASVEEAACTIVDALEEHREGFRRLTARAPAVFEAEDWAEERRNAAARLDLYGRSLDAAVVALRGRFAGRLEDHRLWRATRERYAERVAGSADAELAETFFNSVTRRVFSHAGVDAEIEFVHPASPEPLPRSFGSVTRLCPRRQDTAGLVARLLAHHAFAGGYQDLSRDATRIAAELDAAHPEPVESVQSARSLFFRGKHAYLVGCVHRRGGLRHPIVVPLDNRGGRVAADTVLLTEEEASIVFSFTRSYFFVQSEGCRELVAFLHALMPRKPLSDLYDAIGHPRHGKTELFRALREHLRRSDELFATAPGQRGMVMLVFTLPSFDLVFKVIRDEFPPPKTVTRRSVMAKYELVFKHDRAGRLVDARAFEHLEFERRRFPQPLLEELSREASRTVEVGEDVVVLHHLYTERRLRPLDLFLRETSAAAARTAILDYGEAIRDLARSNIFPGDMLLKNFGVTRHGRVVFYDYDELAVLTDCRFREVPRARYEEEEMAGEPWFFVGENDVFPEEFLPFLGLEGELRDAFMASNRDLLSVEFWTALQEEHRAGRLPDIYPYPQSKRFVNRAAAGG